MKFCSLFSGSSGNCLFVSQGDTRLLIDAGLSGKRIEQALAGIDEWPAALSGILVTHEHRDHISGVGILSRRYGLPIYANAATWEGMAPDLGKIDPANVRVFVTGAAFAIGELRVDAFRTSHDAAESVGYVLDNGSTTLGIATDTGIVTEGVAGALRGCRMVLLESNHDPSMLEAGPYPFPLKQRIKSAHGHLSNIAAAETACMLAENGVEHLVLGHLSHENNVPVLAYQSTAMQLTQRGVKPGSDLTLEVAGRSQRSAVYDL